MKKTILVIIAATLMLFNASLACLISHTQSIHAVHETLEVSDDNQQTTNVETTENGEELQEGEEASASRSQNHNTNNAEEAENTQGVTLNGSSESPSNVCSSDGHVYGQHKNLHMHTLPHAHQRNGSKHQ